MPIILCSYCHYIGQGDDYDDKIVDVEIHEETCSEKTDEELTGERGVENEKTDETKS